MEKIEIDPDIYDKIKHPRKSPHIRACIIELLYNSYDADSSNAKVIFQEFGKDYEIKEESKIIIEDDGIGINLDILKNFFVLSQSKKGELKDAGKKNTQEGRNFYGYHGLGHFKMLLLGRKANIITTPKDDNYTYVMTYDFSAADYKANLIRQPKRKKHGTILEIGALDGKCSESEILKFYRRLSKRYRYFQKKGTKSMKLFIYKDEELINFYFYKYRNKVFLELFIFKAYLEIVFMAVKLFVKRMIKNLAL